jgi:para-nitrobenzyl esterase
MAKPENRMLLNRREAMLLSAAAGMGLAMSRPAHASDSTKTQAHQNPGGCSTPRTAVAKTQYGRVRGFVSGGVFTFKGVPYGQTTGGENRWLPAKPPVPWKDEYPALIYGANCPQRHHDWTGLEQTFLQDWDDGYQSEDMLKLNIWTPSLSGSRAVMVYFHGGGFEFGSAYELPSQDGAQMARNHDVVSVTVNHRLNVLAYLDLTEVGGAAYEDSVNTGLLDLVAALRWIQNNIANFGGDPGRVMIYGQSGGAGKVSNLMGMPAAAGLFHRAASHSGGYNNIPTVEMQREFSRRLVKELGLAPNDIGALQKMEWSRLYAAGNALAAKMNPPWKGLTGPGVGLGSDARVGWMPTLDGRTITMKPFFDGAPEISKDVPFMVGCVSEENMHYTARPTGDQWRASLAKAIGGERADALMAAMKKAHPEKSIPTLSAAVGGLSSRNNVVRMAKMKHDLHAAPAYQFYFTWPSPMLDGHGGAWHTADLAFCFDNTKRCAQATGNSAQAQALATKMAVAWANFAKTGNPSQSGLTWTPSDPEHNQTMVWDNHPRMVNDPDGEARKIALG